MPVAVINRELARRFTNGETRLELTESAGADSIRGVIRALEALYPGIGPELRTGMAVAVDGEIVERREQVQVVSLAAGAGVEDLGKSIVERGLAFDSHRNSFAGRGQFLKRFFCAAIVVKFLDLGE